MSNFTSNLTQNLPNKEAFSFKSVNSTNQSMQEFSDQISRLGKSIGSQPPFMYGAY